RFQVLGASLTVVSRVVRGFNRPSRILNHRPKGGLAEKELWPVVAGKTQTRIDDRNRPLPCPSANIPVIIHKSAKPHHPNLQSPSAIGRLRSGFLNQQIPPAHSSP